ncbi:hypothetical protein [Novosphingobium terrae]|uniref:hypothetical protein n=1 Tax=Novosphingobium terrae TaxID=2726189 RepID=UPI001980B1C2|nr:hypothetical protein [Novosphingobium terrae]
MDATIDTLAGQLIAADLVANEFLLDLNRCLSVPRGFPLCAPWNLPSRLMQSPIEVIRAEGDSPRKLGLKHPGLADHPFVQFVEAKLGVQIAREGVVNAYGVSTSEAARYHHAVDLISAGQWRALIDTIHFSEIRSVFAAIAYGLSYSHHESATKSGLISIAAAREIMREVSAFEPEDRVELMLRFAPPSVTKPEGSAEHWPINDTTALCPEEKAWGYIIGHEDGWFTFDRAGFAQWSEQGRARYAAGDAASFTEQNGQAAFAF